MKDLPPHIYRDVMIFTREMEMIFKDAPHYLGHEYIIPHIGDYSTLSDEYDGRMLVHTEDGIKIVSNVCRHRQAIIQKWKGNTKCITCPLHKWSWNLSGKMQCSPHFDENLSKHLRTWEVESWRWLLFEWKQNIAKKLEKIWYHEEINFQNYKYHRTEYHECRYNWKTFMEVYGDDYHVIPYHPGLSAMVSLKDLEVIQGDGWHIQSVKSNPKTSHNTTPIYQEWREKCLRQGNGILPEYGAIWMAYYPNIMIEVYPYTITVSTLHPISPELTMNKVEFFYHTNAHDGLIEAEEAAYMETVCEDDILAERIEAWRKALIERQKYENIPHDELTWPYHDPMEIGTKHFHEWYQNTMWL